MCVNLKNKSYFNSKKWVYFEIAENFNLGHAGFDKTIGKPDKGEECYFMEKRKEVGMVRTKVELLKRS